MAGGNRPLKWSHSANGGDANRVCLGSDLSVAHCSTDGSCLVAELPVRRQPVDQRSPFQEQGITDAGKKILGHGSLTFKSNRVQRNACRKFISRQRGEGMVTGLHTQKGPPLSRSLLRSLLPHSVLTAEMDPRLANWHDLYAEERDIAREAVWQRRLEFAAGRILAREPLSSFGHQGPLLRSAAGPPVWPDGIVGSISHCASLAAVAICRSRDSAGIGIDVEPRIPLPPEIADLVLTSDSERVIAAGDGGLRVFCAKEAVYKAIFPLTLEIIEFDAVRVWETRSGECFSAELRVGTGSFPAGHVFQGRWKSSDKHVAAAVLLEQSPIDAKYPVNAVRSGALE